MNSPILETPPAPPQTTGEPQFLVAVKVTSVFAVPGMLPPDNTMGARLLYELLQSELRAENNLWADTAVYAGYLNDSFYIFSVRRVVEALEVLEKLLTGIGLRGFSTILHYKHDQFRPYGADGAQIGCHFTIGRVRDVLKIQAEQHASFMRAITAVRAQLVKTAPTPPAAPPSES